RWREPGALRELVAGPCGTHLRDVEPECARMIEPQDVAPHVVGEWSESVAVDERLRNLEVPEGLDERPRVQRHRADRPEQALGAADGQERAEQLREPLRRVAQVGAAALEVDGD